MCVGPDPEDVTGLKPASTHSMRVKRAALHCTCGDMGDQQGRLMECGQDTM